jgi:hypothetical protein
MAKDVAIIYLEADEEIPTIISRLDEIKGREAIFVVPKEAILTHSLINLKLLGREAEKRKKKINIITTDEAGVNLSRKAGFAVFDSVSQAKSLGRVGELDEEEEFDQDETEAEKEVPGKEEVEDENEERYAPAAAATGIEPEAELKPEEVPMRESAVVSPAPVVNRRFGQAKLKNIKLKTILISLAVVVVLAFLVFAYLYLTKATVNLYVKASTKTGQASFTLAQTPSAGELASQTVTVDEQKSVSGKATGQKDEGAKATGQITIYNYWSSDSQVLVAGTKFQAISSNQIFVLTNQVTVPGVASSTAGGVTSSTAGSIVTNVAANDIGAEYNIAPDRFFIPGLSTSEQAKLYGQSSQPMTGGLKKTVTVVSDSDCSQLLTSIQTGLQQNAQNDLSAKAKAYPGDVFNTALIFNNNPQTSCDPAVNSEASSFTAKVQIHYVAFLYKDSDLKALLKSQLAQNLDPTKDISADSFSQLNFTAKKADLNNNNVALTVQTNLILIPKLDLNSIKQNITGKDLDSATKYLNANAQIQNSEVQLVPSFIKRLPRSSSRITINIKEAN